ncbi:MAG: hypothetical protein ABSC63_16065 [Candidatus Binataceae bacterium]|jgi:hypothetical protein
MLFKVALLVALGSVGLMALRRAADARIADNNDHKRERLAQAAAAQLQSLRDHLFKR